MTQKSGRKRPRPLNPEEVAEVIREALGPAGRIFPTSHFRKRSVERNFTMQDTEVLLERGAVTSAQWNELRRTWNYDIFGTDIEGEPLTVQIAVEGPSSIILVTPF